jgi:hypothetical protein
MNDAPVTLVIAIWGAVLGTASFAWNIYRATSDRGRLQVSCRIARFQIVPATFLTGGGRPTEPQIAYTITNVGRRPIFVSHFGGAYRDGKGFEVVPRTSPWPKELKPGESISERAEEPVKVLLNNGGAVFLGAWDTTGKVYKIRRRDLRRLKAEAEHLRREGVGQRAP